MTYLYLGIAIVGEVIATSALKATNEFSRPGPTAVVAAGYLCAFYFLVHLPRQRLEQGRKSAAVTRPSANEVPRASLEMRFGAEHHPMQPGLANDPP
jgi:hypothetical protein